ncbi:SCO4225 family membrane protein [Streptomyces sp. NPDC001514]
MHSGARPLRTLARLTFGNWLSGVYLGLALFLLLIGAGDNGSQAAGLFALLLAVPTGAVLLSVVDSLGAWAETDATMWFILLFSYIFQAFLLGLLVRAARRGSKCSSRHLPKPQQPARPDTGE